MTSKPKRLNIEAIHNSYDSTFRLASTGNPVGEDETYAYDAVGNRTSASNADGEIAHNANNELERYGELEYAYDDNGNMTEVTLSGQVMFKYHYNADNRLIKVEGGNNNPLVEYYYDPFGRRLWKDANQTRTYFFYSDEGLVAEFDISGSEVRSYGYQPDSTWTTDPMWMRYNHAYYFYQNDHLGTPQKLVSQNGAVVWSATYSAFGEAQIEVETVTNNLRFPGQYYDEEIGLHYNFQRYYDPGIGRYVQTDPIGFGGDEANWYVYVRNNPIIFIDIVGFIASRPSSFYQGWGMGMTPPTEPDELYYWPKLCGIRGLRACIVKKVKSWVGEFDYIPGTVYNAYNCADIAIRALIECTAERNIPLTLPTKEGKFYRSKDYTTPEAFFKAAAQDLDAADLFVNDKLTLPRELEDLLPGDIISYDLRDHGNGDVGHTRVVVSNHPWEWFWHGYGGTTEIGDPPGAGPKPELRIPYTNSKPWWVPVPAIDVVEGHSKAPVERKTYAYEQLLKAWVEPQDGKGRTWNCEILEDCAFETP